MFLVSSNWSYKRRQNERIRGCQYSSNKIFGGHKLCHVILVHHGNNHAVTGSHLLVLVKKSHVVTTYLDNTVQTTVQNFLNTVFNWLKNKNSVLLTVFLNVNSVTCTLLQLKLKKELLVTTSWLCLNNVLITLFTVLVLRLLVVKHVNS